MEITSLLIGVSMYDSDKIENLPYCENDIEEMESLLIENIGVNKNNIIKSNTDTKKNSILKDIKKAVSLSVKSELLIVYFTGHGSSENKTGFILPSDTDLSLIADTAISISRFKEIIDTSKAPNKLLIIDSCYSGSSFDKAISSEFIDDFVKSFSKGWTILSSSQGSEKSHFIEDEGMSVFTYFLIEELKKARPKNIKSISIEESLNAVIKRIAEWSLESSLFQVPTYNSERIGGSLSIPIKKTTTAVKSLKKQDFQKATEISLVYNLHIASGFESSSLPIYGTQLIWKTASAIELPQSKWISYTEEERRDNRESSIKEKTEKLNGKLLNFIAPSEIKVENSNLIKYPFGELLIQDRHTFNPSFKLTIDETKLTSETKKILLEIDNQDIMHWQSIQFIYDNKKIDFDKIKDISTEKGYKVISYDVWEKSLTLEIPASKNQTLKMVFQTLDINKCFIEIKESGSLRKDFFEVVPLDSMIEIFNLALIPMLKKK